MHLVRTIYGWRYTPVFAAVAGTVLLTASVLSDGTVTASEWARIGAVLIIATAIRCSHVTRANPQAVREHDYMAGYEQGRRDQRRANRAPANPSGEEIAAARR